VLGSGERERFVGLLLKGASLAVACARIGVSVWAALRTIAQDADLARRLREVNALLSQNVKAALYRGAMEGNVTAQTFWLRSSPPPEWSSMEAAADMPQTYDEVLDGLTDEQLVELARAMGIGLAPEGQAGVAAAVDAAEPGGVPE
jgi:hypothetical protein